MNFEEPAVATTCPTCRWIAEQVPGAVTAMDAFEGAVRSRDARIAALETERSHLTNPKLVNADWLESQRLISELETAQRKIAELEAERDERSEIARKDTERLANLTLDLAESHKGLHRLAAKLGLKDYCLEEVADTAIIRITGKGEKP